MHVGTLDRDEGSLERDEWPWLPGTVLGQCGPDEWHVRVDADDDEDGQVDEDGLPVRWYPACFRDSSELRLAVDVDDTADGRTGEGDGDGWL